MEAELIRTIAELRSRLAEVRRRGTTIGLVPTMGALHAGHGALITRARQASDCVVVSIFVNPIQFDRREDYEAYQVNLGRDVEYCGTLGTDIVFAPAPEEMYPSPQSTLIEVTGVSDHLCGRFRPGHFRGVATVVAKLFQIVDPDLAFFGEKDAQQLAVVQKMVVDLNMPVRIVPVATVRERDGLAMSSRNARLSPAERAVAPALYQALESARARIEAGCGSAAEVRQTALLALEQHPQMRVEYVEVVNPATMTPVQQIAGPVRIAAAVWLGSTRLIDNVL
jgi:pantoate--beta-alanine ligase